MMKIVTFVKMKGGVGSTTLAWNFSKFLEKKGKKVLAIDLDHQLNYTMLNLVDGEQPDLEFLLENSVGEIFNGNQVEIAEVSENFSLIGGDISLDELEVTLATKPNKDKLLLKWLKANKKALQNFDYIIIDTRPEFSTVSKNAIMISDCLIHTVEPSDFSQQGFENYNFRFEDFVEAYDIEGDGKSDVKATMLYVANKIALPDSLGRLNRHTREFLQMHEGKTEFVASFPQSDVFKTSISKKKSISDLSELGRYRSDYGEKIFKIVDEEFEKLKQAIDKEG